MPTIADSLTSSGSRPLPMRMRGDLIAQRQIYQGREFWVVKDPLALNYFRMEAEELALLKMLDGEHSLEQIQAKFEAQFPPQRITPAELHQHIGVFHRQGLLITGTNEQGTQLRKRAQKKRRSEWLQKFTNILSIRFKGIDPEKLLTWLHPKVRWFFTPVAVAACLLLGCSALLLVLTQFETFRAKLPGFHEFFAVSNWFYLAAALAVTKVIHEFGHGLLCKHFGGECHEMGLLLLCLTPCLYCNVSDSWLLPSKWRRAAIGAGGMYVELVMASIATFLWWFSEPGLIHELSLAVMFVCSVSTLVFNANPLMRYDGYYILADILEIPNLRQKSNTLLQRKCSQWCLGLEPREDPFLPRRNQLLFVIFAIASFIYGWIVVLGILFFLNKVFEPYGLKIIGQMLAVCSIAGMFVQPLHKLWNFIIVPGRMEKVKKSRLFATKAVVIVLLLLFAFLPLPRRIMCALEVKPHNAQAVYVKTPGMVQQVLVRPGQRVKAGDAIAVLSDTNLLIEKEQLEGQRAEMVAKMEALRGLPNNTPTAREQFAALTETAKAVTEKLRDKEREIAFLTLVAPCDGYVFAFPGKTAGHDQDDRLPQMTGTPFDTKNANAWLDRDLLFCQIGEPNDMRADLFIDQSDVEFVHSGQAIEMKLDQFHGETFVSHVDQVACQDAKTTPKQLSHKSGGQLQTKTDTGGVERPESASYQANATISDPSALLRPGYRGEARISVGWQSLGSRFARYLSHTFNFKL